MERLAKKSGLIGPGRLWASDGLETATCYSQWLLAGILLEGSRPPSAGGVMVKISFTQKA